ncbi:MAG: phosphatase PAP2 family protein, partial [Bacilli bacterium]|nr:phosphatase PAP2 family protein [Bacilli bacterium]
AAGMCLFKAINKKGGNYKFLAWTLLVIAFFLAVYYSDNYNGSKLREALGDFKGVSVVAYLIWILIYSWVPVVCYYIIDDSHPERLIAVGVTILVAGVVSDCMNLWLKQVASRPRYSYLIKEFADDVEAQRANFKNWWEWNPYMAGSDDNFKSWPSGNMTIATITCALPLLAANVKKSNKIAVYIAFGFSCAFVILYGYNRIHMGKHFLTDVCFGVLFTYIIYALVDQGFELSYKSNNTVINKIKKIVKKK